MKYTVEVKETDTYFVQVDADSEIDARIKAAELLNDKREKYNSFAESDTEMWVYER